MTRFYLPIVIAVLLCSRVAAQNVDLVTLPTRDTVQLTIYNSEDLTLVNETRFVTLKQGANRLQFSWSGTLIDPTSVELRPLAHADAIDVVDTIYPGQKPDHLIWNVTSEIEGQVPVEVSYFTSGLTWQMDYVAVANPEETSLDFRGYVRVFNNSGEEYENAQVRLIVGTINLVEKIAQLAQQRGIPVPQAATPEFKELLDLSVRDAFGRGGGFGGGGMAKPKEIIKEGLSEYFMFSIEGQESIPNGWSKRMQAVHAQDVSFDIVYRMREYQYGPRPVRFFVWQNDEPHHLGQTPLPNGVVRVFRDNGQQGLAYLGQQNLNYVPVQAEIEVNLGVDDLVVYERRSGGTSRMNFAFNEHEQVTGWDQQQKWIDTIRNYRAQPITFQLRLQFAGDVEFRATHPTTSFDYQTVEAVFQVSAASSQQYEYSVTTHSGSNAKQNRVVILAEP